MEEPNLKFLDPDKIVRSLNPFLVDGSRILSPVKYRAMSSRASGVGLLEERIVAGEGIFFLQQYVNSSLRELGGISVETGAFEDPLDPMDHYESLKLHIMHPLWLKDGEILPSCQIDVAQFYVDGRKSSPLRKDYKIIWMGLGRRRADLVDILPTPWFLRD